MKPLLAFGFILLLAQGYGQNLIPDPYFNQLRNCSNPSKDDFTHYWYCPTDSQCHAYHVCSGNIPLLEISGRMTNRITNIPNLALVPFPIWPMSLFDDVLIEAFDPLPDTMLFCASQTTPLNAGFHDATYQWNTGERDSAISVSRSGKYKVQATIDTLVFEDSTVVIYMDDFSNHTTIDTFFCTNSELNLGPPVPGNAQWSNGHDASALTIRETGIYRLIVDNKCGSYQFTYQVSEKDCNCELDLPTAFSPNGDSRNDIFTIIDQCRYRKWTLGSFQVYDQWGGMVYQENGPSVRWDDHSSNGEAVPPGVYTYRLAATVQQGMEEDSIVKTGSVQLLR